MVLSSAVGQDQQCKVSSPDLTASRHRRPRECEEFPFAHGRVVAEGLGRGAARALEERRGPEDRAGKERERTGERIDTSAVSVTSNDLSSIDARCSYHAAAMSPARPNRRFCILRKTSTGSSRNQKLYGYHRQV